MKMLTIIFFLLAALHCVAGILLCCGRFKETALQFTDNPNKAGAWFIALAVIFLLCGFISLSDSPFAVIFLAAGAFLVKIISDSAKFDGNGGKEK